MESQSANQRRMANRVELAGAVAVIEGPSRDRASAYVDVTVPSERNPEKSDRLRVAFFGDAITAEILAFKGDARTLLVTGYLTTRYDAESQKRVPSITGTSISVAPEGMTRRNYVELGGYLGQDPELRGESTPRSRVGIGIGKDKFVPVVGFADVAQSMVEALHQGDGATFEGRLANHSFQDRGQGNRQRWEIQVIASKFAVEHVKQVAHTMVGEITSEPAFSSNGKARFAFTMTTPGVDAGYPDRESVNVAVIAFDRAAVALREQGFVKGQSVVVDGRVRESEYQGKTQIEVHPNTVLARDVAVDRDLAVEDLAPPSAEIPAGDGKGVNHAFAAAAVLENSVTVDDPKAELYGAPEPEPAKTPIAALPQLDLPKITQVVERDEFPDPIVGTVAGLDEDGRLLAHIGRGIAVAIEMDACSPRVPSAGEKVQFVRNGAQELVNEVALAGLELAK